MQTTTRHLLRTGLLVAALTLTGLGTASADIVISVTGKSQSNYGSYVAGQNYTFNFTINPAFTNSAWKSYVIDTCNRWRDGAPSDLLFSSITGDGLSGTFAPTSPNDKLVMDTTPYFWGWDNNDNYVQIPNYDYGITLGVAPESGSTGLTLGSDVVFLILGHGLIDGGVLTPNYSYISPTVYFANHTGTYAPLEGADFRINDAFFTPVSTTIWNTSGGGDVAAVPEPSTWMMWLVGGVTLGGLKWRQHRARR